MAFPGCLYCTQAIAHQEMPRRQVTGMYTLVLSRIPSVSNRPFTRRIYPDTKSSISRLSRITSVFQKVVVGARKCPRSWAGSPYRGFSQSIRYVSSPSSPTRKFVEFSSVLIQHRTGGSPKASALFQPKSRSLLIFFFLSSGASEDSMKIRAISSHSLRMALRGCFGAISPWSAGMAVL